MQFCLFIHCFNTSYYQVLVVKKLKTVTIFLSYDVHLLLPLLNAARMFIKHGCYLYYNTHLIFVYHWPKRLMFHG